MDKIALYTQTVWQIKLKFEIHILFHSSDNLQAKHKIPLWKIGPSSMRGHKMKGSF